MKPKGLLARFEEVASVPHHGRRELSKNTKDTYVFWIRKFHGYAHKPASTWTADDVERYIWWLKQEGYAGPSRKQALCALVYIFKNVLNLDLGVLNLPAMPKEKKRLKVIPTREELGRIFSGLRGQFKTMAGVMYGSGLRVIECCQLRVKDIDFESSTIRVYDGKGGKDRLCLLPCTLVPALQRQIAMRRALHERDLADGAGFVELPGRLAIKYPGAARDLSWQYLFPSAVLRGQKRWHATPQGIQKAIKQAVHAAGILKLITPHTLRHAFCTHALRSGNDPATVQELMGHEDFATTQTYAHADHARGVSPLDVGDITPTRIAQTVAF